MQKSYAIDYSDTSRESEHFSSSFPKKQEVPQDLAGHKPQLNEEKKEFNSLLDNSQQMPQSFTEKVEQLRQYLWGLWDDPLGFKEIFKNISFN